MIRHLGPRVFQAVETASRGLVAGRGKQNAVLEKLVSLANHGPLAAELGLGFYLIGCGNV